MVFRLEDTAGERSLVSLWTIVVVIAAVLFAKALKGAWITLKILVWLTIKLVVGFGAIILTIAMVVATVAMVLA